MNQVFQILCICCFCVGELGGIPSRGAVVFVPAGELPATGHSYSYHHWPLGPGRDEQGPSSLANGDAGGDPVASALVSSPPSNI